MVDTKPSDGRPSYPGSASHTLHYGQGQRRPRFFISWSVKQTQPQLRQTWYKTSWGGVGQAKQMDEGVRAAIAGPSEEHRNQGLVEVRKQCMHSCAWQEPSCLLQRPLVLHSCFAVCSSFTAEWSSDVIQPIHLKQPTQWPQRIHRIVQSCTPLMFQHYVPQRRALAKHGDARLQSLNLEGCNGRTESLRQVWATYQTLSEEGRKKRNRRRRRKKKSKK